MPGPAAILREIHRLRVFASDLQSRIDLAPKQVKAQQGQIAKREDEFKHGQEAVKKLKIGIHEHEVSIKAEQQLIKKYEHQLNDITSKKEYDALRHEIAAVQEKIRGVEDELLAAMLQVDEEATKLPALDEGIKKAKAEFEEFNRDLQARLADWSKQRDSAISQISTEEAKLPEQVRPMYDRFVKSMGADALATVEGKNCAACYTEMTMQTYHDVLNQQFVQCRNCGRILYGKETR
jgi:predicted  nucleic acid-binding Zn-ribbon protein